MQGGQLVIQLQSVCYQPVSQQAYYSAWSQSVSLLPNYPLFRSTRQFERQCKVINLCLSYILLYVQVDRKFKMVLALSHQAIRGHLLTHSCLVTVVGFISYHKYLKEVLRELLKRRKLSTRDIMCSPVFTL